MDFNSRWDISEERKCLIYVANVSHLVGRPCCLLRETQQICRIFEWTLFRSTLRLFPSAYLSSRVCSTAEWVCGDRDRVSGEQRRRTTKRRRWNSFLHPPDRQIYLYIQKSFNLKHKKRKCSLNFPFHLLRLKSTTFVVQFLSFSHSFTFDWRRRRVDVERRREKCKVIVDCVEDIFIHSQFSVGAWKIIFTER